MKTSSCQPVYTLTPGDSAYPFGLRQLSDRRPNLWVRGVWPKKRRYWLAVVGTRRHSKSAPEIVTKLVTPLARAGAVIVSGLAYGIDALAHEATLASGGLTVAVLGSCLDNIQPSGNSGLAERIVTRGGALVSEYPPGTPVTKANFPARNRIIAGLAQATLVVEAPRKSGALITAHHALKLRRLVLAVPGSVLAETSIGTNDLIRRGARAVASAQDIARALGLSLKKPAAAALKTLTGTEEQVYQCLTREPAAVDRIAHECILEPSVALAALTRLELMGLAHNLGGMVFIRK